MRLHILSDLHLEFAAFNIPDLERDILILAGDVSLGKKAQSLLEKEAKNSTVIYILGNHEYYNQEFDAINHFWATYQFPNVIFLEKRAVIIENTRFIGTTLWSDFDKGNGNSMEMARLQMNDYTLIKKGQSWLFPEDTYRSFQESYQFLRRELATPFNGKTVVVTHHLPSWQSIAECFMGSELNGAFASDLEPLIQQYQPELWIHGHTHRSFDYRIGKTRIICNPRGYVPNEPNPEFDPYLIIEL